MTAPATTHQADGPQVGLNSLELIRQRRDLTRARLSTEHIGSRAQGHDGRRRTPRAPEACGDDVSDRDGDLGEVKGAQTQPR